MQADSGPIQIPCVRPNSVLLSRNMEFREIIRILTSKAVLLTYVFIGYLAVAERALPVCNVDPIPACSTNELAYPSAQTHPVAMAEHVRSAKQLLLLDAVETHFFDKWLVTTAGRISVCYARPPTLSSSFGYFFTPRAPPAPVS